MGKVNIPLLEEWKDKMLDGVKICTTRPTKYGNPGDTFEAFGATFKIYDVFKTSLGDVAFNLHIEEGCIGPAAFVDVWIRLHPGKGFDSNQKVWAHLFAQVE